MRARLLVPVLLLASLPASAAEAPPWERAFLEAPPAEVLAAAAALPAPEEGSDLDLLLADTTIRFDDLGRRETVFRLVIRVLTPAGAQQIASIGAFWSPWAERRPALRARVIAADGVAHRLDPATLVENGATPEGAPLFVDRRVLHGPLPAVAVGAVVEEEVTTQTETPLLPADVRASFNSEVRVGRLRVEAPRSLPLHFAVHGLAGEPTRTSAGDRQVWVFEVASLPKPPARPADAPITLDTVRQVGVSTGTSWAEVARRYHSLVEKQLEGAEADVRELVAGLDRKAGPDALVPALLARIDARVRYVALELGQGSVVPRRPAETLARRYGDCKDLSTLLVAALRSLGVEAHVALVGTGTFLPDPALPGFGMFDHAIVAISGAPPRFVDPTDPASAGRLLPEPVQGRPALVAAPATSGLVTLPTWRAADSVYRTTYSIELAERGRARVVQDVEVEGPPATRFRQRLPAMGPALQEQFGKWWSEFLDTEHPVVPSVEAGGPGQPYRFHAEATDSGLGKTDAEAAVAELPLLALFGGIPDAVGPEAKEPRKHDLALTPFRSVLTVRVVPPPGHTLDQRPEERNIAAGPVTLRRAIEVLPEGAVLVRTTFDTGDRRVLAAADAEALRLAVRDFSRVRLRFRRNVAVHLAAGRYREAVDEERRLAALHPAEARHHEELARLYLDVGLGAEALAEARKAVEVEPGAESAQRTLAWIAQHDRFGRHFFPGWDRAAVLAAYRRAIELEPEDGFALGALGDVLAHGNSGRWYDAGADLDAAIEAYRSAGDRIQERYRVNRLFFQLRAERFAELIETAPGIPAGAARDELWVAAVAATTGIEAAVEKAAALAEGAEQRLSILSGAAGQLARVRRYDLAAGLLERIAPGAPNAHDLQAGAALYRKTRRLAERPADAGPAGVFDRLLALRIRPEPARDDVRALFSTAVALENPDLPLDELVSIGPPAAGEDTVLPDPWADRWSSWHGRTTEGDDRSGYRVRVETPNPIVFFVVREGDAYRLRAWGNRLGALGHEALACLDRGDVEGARRWLTWAADVPRPAAGACDRLAPARRVTERGAAATGDELRRAAAVLSADGPVAARLDRALEARAAATDPAEALALDQSLVFSTNRHRRGDAAAAVAERLAAAFPTSTDVFWARLVGHPDPAERRALVASLRPQVERTGDVPLQNALAGAASNAGDLDTAEAVGLALEASGRATPAILNRLAWNALFRPGLDAASLDAAIERAREAARRTDQKNRAMLHTLATLLAEAGRVREASDTLRASLALRTGEPDVCDRYTSARIAEQLGLRDEATAGYRSVAAGPDEDATSCEALARRRLATLAASR